MSSSLPVSLADSQVKAIEKLAVALLETENQSNQVVSGLSAWLVLSALYAGSGGASSAGLETLLGAGDDDLAALRSQVGELLATTQGLRHATALWSKVSLMPEFVQTFQKEITFSSEINQRALDEWTREATDGLLQKFPIEIDDEALLVIADALSIRARWEKEFVISNTAPRIFFCENEETVTCDFMNGASSIHYATKTDTYVGWSKVAFGPRLEDNERSWNRSRYIVQFVMPTEEGTKSHALIASMQRFHSTLSDGTAIVALPKFSIKASADLMDVIRSSSASVITTDDADFGGLSPTPLKVSKARQDVVLRIDELGFEAAAVSAVEAMIGNLKRQVEERIEIVFDHPFAVSVIEAETDIVLFTAWISDPTE